MSYDPSQPRDSHGRFASSNGNSANGTKNRAALGHHSEPIAALPQGMHVKAKIGGGRGRISPALAALLGAGLGATGAILRGVTKRRY